MERRPGPVAIFVAFLKLGLTAFGGPAMVKYIKELACKKRKWVKPEEFDHGIALVQTIPGATAMQAAAFAGLKAGGGLGAVSAYVGFALPAFFLILFLTLAYVHAMDISFVAGGFNGLKVVVVAIVANATLSFGKKIIRSPFDAVLVIASAFFLFKKQNPIFIIGACAISGLFWSFINKRDSSEDGRIPLCATSLKDSLAQKENRSVLLFAALIVILSTGLIGLIAYFRPQIARLCLVMMKCDFFAYGGGYASLPLLFHEIVDKRGLLDAKVFMDGIALGQITPGPIVITAAFVGFLLYGLLGAVLFTWAIFTPSFVILLLATPFFDYLKNKSWFKGAMQGILASFVGLLFAVLLSFLLAVNWTPLKIFIGTAAFLALVKGIDILYVVLLTGIVSAIFL